MLFDCDLACACAYIWLFWPAATRWNIVKMMWILHNHRALSPFDNLFPNHASPRNFKNLQTKYPPKQEQRHFKTRNATRVDPHPYLKIHFVERQKKCIPSDDHLSHDGFEIKSKYCSRSRYSFILFCIDSYLGFSGWHYSSEYVSFCIFSSCRLVMPRGFSRDFSSRFCRCFIVYRILSGFNHKRKSGNTWIHA